MRKRKNSEEEDSEMEVDGEEKMEHYDEGDMEDESPSDTDGTEEVVETHSWL